jgi:hypothetical protein
MAAMDSNCQEVAVPQLTMQAWLSVATAVAPGALIEYAAALLLCAVQQHLQSQVNHCMCLITVCVCV